MRSGRLRHVVVLKKPSLTDDGMYGQKTKTYSTVDTVRARVRDLRGREFFAGEQNHAEIDKVIELRYRSDIRPTWQIWETVDGVEFRYDVVAVTDPVGRRRELEVVVKLAYVKEPALPSNLVWQSGDNAVTQSGSNLVVRL